MSPTPVPGSVSFALHLRWNQNHFEDERQKLR